MTKRIDSFEDLIVYQKAFEIQQRIFEITKTFPVNEKYSLTDQIRRSSRSIGANIAEAWHKRLYPAHFVSKLSDADGEQAETHHWVESAFACDYIDEEIRNELLTDLKKIGRMLGTMMAHPEKFCK